MPIISKVTFFGYSLESMGLILVSAFLLLTATIILIHFYKYRVLKVVNTDESVIKVVRKHWFVILGSGVRTIILLLLPILFYKIFLSNLFLSSISSIFSQNLSTDSYSLVHSNILALLKSYSGYIKIFYSLWILILVDLFFVDWVLYYLDMWVVTSKRILCIDQKWFFNREVISFNYEQIQDITVETRGFLQNMLDFGLLNIETAGEKSMISIKNASRPEQARSIILEQQEKSFSLDRSLGKPVTKLASSGNFAE